MTSTYVDIGNGTTVVTYVFFFLPVFQNLYEVFVLHNVFLKLISYIVHVLAHLIPGWMEDCAPSNVA